MASQASGFTAHVDRFRDHLPGVFNVRPEDWQGEQWIDVGSDELIGPIDWNDPTGAGSPELEPALSDASSVDRLDFDLEGYIAERIGGGFRPRRVLLPPGKLRGGHPGAPVRIEGPWDPGVPPVPEAIAFYLPAHFFPHSKGIYFIFENWVQFCVALHALACKHGAPPTVRQVIEASVRYLYPHEYYHHKVEMFGFRWEAFVRSRFYAKAVRDLYRDAPSDPDHLEESLATAFGIAAVREHVRLGKLPESLARAVEDYSRALPPHYSRGIAIIERQPFELAESAFLERCGMAANPKKFTPPAAGLWGAAPYRLAGSLRPGSPFTFLIDRGNAVLARLRLGLRGMRVRELRKELQSHGYQLDRQGGNHEIWASPDGKRKIPVPRHPGDLHPGLVRRMLKEMRGA